MDKNVATLRRTQGRSAAKQRGAALVLIVVAMVVLLLMAGLALDVGHMMLNKTRLQNSVDTAALSAAKTLDQTGSTTLATAAALQGLGLDANTTGNGELGDTYDGNNLQVTVQYSSTLPPFAPGSTTGPYVRVIATGFTFPTALIEVAGLKKLGVRASAVAGPSPTINTACNLAPIMACGLSPSQGGSLANLWGYQLNTPQVLKSSAPGSSAVGPGNFQLIQLSGPGDNIVRQNLAGSYQSCQVSGNTVQTEAGNGAGPTADGLNTRFGIYDGTLKGTSSQYPPDVITQFSTPEMTVDSNGDILYQQSGGTTVKITSSTIGDVYNYQNYEDTMAAGGPWDFQPLGSGGTGILGVFDRRVLTVPIGDCTGTATGSTTVPIMGFACFFLLQPVCTPSLCPGQGGAGLTDYIIGEFEGNCQVNGDPGPNPGAGPGPYIIELYHDPGSPDS